VEKKLTKNNKHKIKMKNLTFGLFMGLTSICQSQWSGNTVHINGCNDPNLPTTFLVGDSVDYSYGDGSPGLFDISTLPSWETSWSDDTRIIPVCTIIYIKVYETGCSGWDNGVVSSVKEFPVLSTSINEVKNLEFNMFPNPTNDILTIQVENRSNLDMFSMSGQLIMSMMVNNGSNSVDLSDVPTGVYMVKINNVTKQLIRL
jgi:hypothetical protein